MRILNLKTKNAVFGSAFNYSKNFKKEATTSMEFGFLEARLRRLYARLALGANFANKN